MAREITPNSIRETALKRRLRGYDPHETEQLLADVAESLEGVLRDRSSLSARAAELQSDLEEAERAFESELDRLNKESAACDKRLSELEAELTRLQKERSKHTEEADRLGEELSGTKAAHEDDRAALTELRETVGRLETREKALVEQISMLESQLEHARETEATPVSPQAPTDLDDRASTTLLRLDHALETIEREAREEAELTLRRAQEQAEEILRSAELQRQRIETETVPPNASDEERDEYDPVAALGLVEHSLNEAPAADGAEDEVGEAEWTSGSPGQFPERYS